MNFELEDSLLLGYAVYVTAKQSQYLTIDRDNLFVGISQAVKFVIKRAIIPHAKRFCFIRSYS